jgi:hypothetical protein
MGKLQASVLDPESQYVAMTSVTVNPFKPVGEGLKETRVRLNVHLDLDMHSKFSGVRLLISRTNNPTFRDHPPTSRNAKGGPNKLSADIVSYTEMSRI